MLNLSVHHNIYLTREQRYAIHDEKPVDVVGISVPVWHVQNVTSEPAKEIFCIYRLRNPKHELPIKILDDGYEVTLPCRDAKAPTRPLSNEQWRKLNEDEREMYYKMMGHQASSKNLLDLKDGGSACLMYREHNKAKKDDKIVNIAHYVHIEDMSHLMKSIEYPS